LQSGRAVGLREKVKTRRLAPADYSGATFYLSDLGVFSVVDAFDSIVPIGASAILSVAASRPQGVNRRPTWTPLRLRFK